MKNIIKYILVISLISLWNTSQADEKITNGSKVKVKPGTHLIDKSSIYIENNGQLIVEGMLTVDNFLNNNTAFEGIQIKSTAENTGSIIYQNGTPMALIERYMRSARPHYIGSPVVGETANALDFAFPNTYLYEYTDGLGLQLIEDNSTELINGKGYYYRINPTNNGGLTPKFEGTLTAGDLILNSNSNPPLNYNTKGINVIANPYSCAIDWDDESIEISDMEASVWVYDANTRRYKFRNNSGYGSLKDGIIPMGQGFYIKAQSEEASLSIPAQARLHQEQAFYKQTEEVYEDLNYAIFEIVKDSLADEIWLGYQWNSTDGFDNGIDISKMFTFEEEPQIYSSHNNEDFTIDLIEAPELNSKQVPVYLRVGSSGTHHLNLLEYQGFSNVDVQLEDLVTGEFLEVIDMDSYDFEANVGDDELRFILHFNPTIYTGSDPYLSRENQVDIYSYGEQIYIKSNGDYVQQSKIIHLFDLNGKLLAEIPLSAGHLNSIKNNFKRKMIIVRAKYLSDTFTEKIIFIK